MASAPAPSAWISANGSFWVPSRTRPLEPTQIAPDFSTTGNKAAASPPVMGSLALPRETRFETTTRFTGSPPVGSTRVVTTIHQYGSPSPFQRIETKIGLRRAELTGTHEKENFARNITQCAKKPHSIREAEKSMAALGPFRRQADAREIPHHRRAE